jgi:hypothetical protein
MRHFDVDTIDQELAAEVFDPISFVNTILPDEGSLGELAQMIQQLKIRSRRITASIREAVRSYSVLGDTSDAILADTRNSIVDLSHRIATIHDEATETETVVSRICEGIKPLDRAKCNLTVSVATLRNLRSIVESLDQLERHISESNYAQCAELVTNVAKLFDFFKLYLSRSRVTPQISPLASRFFDLKRMLRNKVNLELEGRLFRGSADEANLPICAVIDAFQDDFHSSTVDLFCEKFLGPYDDAYEKSPLKDVKARYEWFKQRIDFYNKMYQAAFPPDWRMQYQLSLQFCNKTGAHLARLMDAKAPDVKTYLQAFELTVKFEQKMADLFATEDMIFIGPDDPMPEFENTPDGVRARIEWRLRRDQGIGEKRRLPANEFIGSIAASFAKHMSLYLEADQEALSQVINEAKKHPLQDIDPETRQLTSATTLVMAMKKSIDKCAGFHLPQSLLDLFLNLKGLLNEYVQVLTRVLPPKPKSDQDYQLLATIANTSATLLQTIDSLANRVGSLITEDLKPAIRVDDAKEDISVHLRKQLIYIADVVVAECSALLIQVGTGGWDQSNPEAAKLPPRLSEIFRARFTVLGEWLSTDNLNRLRSTFASKVVAAIHDAMFKMKQLSSDAGWKISIAVKEVKTLVAVWTKADSQLAKKRIDSEFLQLEVEVRVSCSPDPEATAVTYITMMNKPTKEHFRAILRLRGLPAAKEQEFLIEYDHQLAVLSQPQ